MICRRGERSIITSGHGVVMGHGKRFTTAFAGQVRQAAGRNPEPSGAVVDSQSVQTSEQGGIRGHDAAKKVSGRKRHVLVDTLGLVLRSWSRLQMRRTGQRPGSCSVCSPYNSDACRIVWADGAYAGGLEQWVRRLRPWGKVRLEIVRKPKGQRALRCCRGAGSWSESLRGRWRRLKADYECLPETTEALIHIAMIRLMLRRLAAG
jgi:putative transposase